MAKKAAKKVVAKSESIAKKGKNAVGNSTKLPEKASRAKPVKTATKKKSSRKKSEDEAESMVDAEGLVPKRAVSKRAVSKRSISTKNLAEKRSADNLVSQETDASQVVVAPKKRVSKAKSKSSPAEASGPAASAVQSPDKPTLLVVEEASPKVVRQDVKVGVHGTNPMYIVEYLMFVKGHYWYGTSSCERSDSLSGILVSTIPKANAPRNKLGDELRRRVYESPKIVHIDIDPATEPSGLFESDGRSCKTNCDASDVFPFADRVHRILESSVAINDPSGIVGNFRIMSIKLHDGSERLLSHPVGELSLIQGLVKKIRSSKVLKPGKEVTPNIFVVDIECKGDGRVTKTFKNVSLLNAK